MYLDYNNSNVINKTRMQIHTMYVCMYVNYRSVVYNTRCEYGSIVNVSLTYKVIFSYFANDVEAGLLLPIPSYERRTTKIPELIARNIIKKAK